VVVVEPAASTEPRARRDLRLQARVAVTVAAIALGGVAGAVAARGGGSARVGPVAEVPAPAPDPVVVVVPVDPFTGWEVGGDVVDPFCGC
jgi:hypothetical protein